MRNFAIIEAPSVLGHISTHLGVAHMPEALLNAGLATRLNARLAGRVESPPWRIERDPETQIMNPHAINEYSISLADAVGKVMDNDEFPVVIGGDCSILLGTMLALKRRGRYGVLYLDGHADFYEADNNPIAGAASASDLGYATGRGPAVVADIEGQRPLLRDEDVVLFGYRDGAIQARNRGQQLPRDLMALNRQEVRILGTETAAEEAVAHLTREDGPEGFWIHVDVDVLDQGIMWAVDHPQPDGFSWEDLGTTLRTAMSSPRAIGIQFTIYNPEMDPGGLSGRGLAATIGKALGQFANR
ncbi:arginase family protein [Pseudomonas gingeri]|uniref:arginase family protein n=1 Tax=Pseudomonas gingeri TaxID=117681 RepID=UPI0015A14768|nr:arginase family protein [Pseudomonas gingeri]NWA01692.1 arginase family protein [Pseudomonas gingeri]NWA12791.1 arginase family protein [Pseudomonas gingeri]NWA57533.1 arginase family protein [Pseudomonas gingeri]NWA93162.1 arginase family protein [Pseudomonas gingeri]NWB03478.1 arginase family protein [Pseudomonas gingeri]